MAERALDLKRRLRAGATALGAWLSISDPVVAEIMAGAGFDYILIDTEHAPWSLESLQTALLAFRGMPTVPIVRVPWNDQVHVKQALDVGAEGVLAPMVRSAAEARALVAAAKYPPDGIRGFGPRRASDYGRNLDAYVASANAATIVIPQIEHVDAAAAIEEILAVPGVDALCIGPNDLSGSAGVLRQHDHPTVRGAIEKVLSAASAKGVAVCTGITLPLERQREWIARGARLTLLTSDVELLAGGAGAVVTAARAAFGR